MRMQFMAATVRFIFLFSVSAPLAFPSVQATAQDAAPPNDEPAASSEESDDGELRPTEIGIRFTPHMASAISKKFVEAMKPRYGLDDKQVEEVADVMQRQFMKFSKENAVLGRDMVEMMMATMLEHDGRFPKEEAVQFAKMANKFTPKLKEFFTESSAQIGRKMTMKQKLQFTGDVGIAAAGLVVFENRMKRWEEGKIGDFANPFFDPADNDPTKAEPEPVDPKEHAEHRKARKEVEAWIAYSIDKDNRWAGYLEQAVKYYNFTEPQRTAAQSILKDCQDRAKTIKSVEWRSAVTENRIMRNFTYKLGDEFVNGPWMVSLEEAFAKLLKPIEELDKDFKRRIDELPDSTQRATARENVRKALADKGVKQLPN